MSAHPDTLSDSRAAQSRLLPAEGERERLRRRRRFNDGLSRYGVAAGGGGVVIALALIFVYLLSEILPLFGGASLAPRQAYDLRTLVGGISAAHVAMERYGEVGVVFGEDGTVTFFGLADGKVRQQERLPIPADVGITSFAQAEPRSGLVAYGLSDGTALVVKHEYRLTYADERRHVVPELSYPLGETPVPVDAQGQALQTLAIQEGSSGMALAAASADGRLVLARFSSSVSFMTGEVSVEASHLDLQPAPHPIVRVLLDSRMRDLYAADAQGNLHYYDVGGRVAPAPLRQSVRVVPEGATVTAVDFLIGTVSLIVGGSDGSVSQWFLVRDAANRYTLTRVRDFDRHRAPVVSIAAEHSRKGFATADSAGNVKLHFATSSSTVLDRALSQQAIHTLSFSPVNDAMLVLDAAGRLQWLELDNDHPDVSFSALWSKVWYEGRAAPEYVWQASSATDEFEPKYSLVPLSLGTLKAALFAMLFAMPLAVMGAIYSAYFMTPKLRGVVKPTIEVMEALPTVILGFLAGLWLAPFMENNLPAVFSVLILTPLGMLLAALAWFKLPAAAKHAVPSGWEAALLVPVVVLIGWFSVSMSPVIELHLFGGSMRQWLTDVGITYDQRNAMVVGVAMGFAVIPTIYSIAEDAVFNVPKHLTQGSLALGATPWQTVTGVVLLTASPGIFSAVMIGFGRAVGETMIVLMATGNSPIMNFNIFEGMRTLSANIAVELPETAVHSSHFRILFLAALVLFAFTFIVNTIAEMVRQRLRRRYASL